MPPYSYPASEGALTQKAPWGILHRPPSSSLCFCKTFTCISSWAHAKTRSCVLEDSEVCARKEKNYSEVGALRGWFNKVVMTNKFSLLKWFSYFHGWFKARQLCSNSNFKWDVLWVFFPLDPGNKAVKSVWPEKGNECYLYLRAA